MNITISKFIRNHGLMAAIRQKYGVVCDTDSYKLSHHPQYRDGADAMISYLESRGGLYDHVVWFGLQLIIKEYLLQPLTRRQAKNMVKWAKEHMMGNMTQHFKTALDVVIKEYNGKLPIVIRAAAEGRVIPVKNVLATIETSVPDPRIFSLVSYFEAKILRVWSPTTVATVSYNVRKVIYDALVKSSDDPDGEINFKLHDFGSRGASSGETAAFAGAGHLVNFMGSDTTIATMVVEMGYGERMASYSIPASEHSTTTSNGVTGEIYLVRKMIDNYAVKGGLFATVADSYDVLNFIRKIVPQFKDEVAEKGAAWIVRPDSNDPIEMPIKCIVELDKVCGSTTNSKGFKVINGIRVIQGDGICPRDVEVILQRLLVLGYSATNIAFGMGGGLLQKNDRDTQKFSVKCSAIRVNGVWEDVYKDPAVYDAEWNKLETSSFKKSKKGRIELIYNPTTKDYKTVREEEVCNYPDYVLCLETVYKDGELIRDMSFAEVRSNSKL